MKVSCAPRVSLPPTQIALLAQMAIVRFHAEAFGPYLNQFVCAGKVNVVSNMNERESSRRRSDNNQEEKFEFAFRITSGKGDPSIKRDEILAAVLAVAGGECRQLMLT